MVSVEILHSPIMAADAYGGSIRTRMELTDKQLPARLDQDNT